MPLSHLHMHKYLWPIKFLISWKNRNISWFVQQVRLSNYPCSRYCSKIITNISISENVCTWTRYELRLDWYRSVLSTLDWSGFGLSAKMCCENSAVSTKHKEEAYLTIETSPFSAQSQSNCIHTWLSPIGDFSQFSSISRPESSPNPVQ